MDEHEQALAWATANPNDPRAQDIQAKAWASKNPDDPRSSAILQKLGGAPKESAMPAPRGAAQQDIADLNQMDPGMKKGFAKALLAEPVMALSGGAAAGLGSLGRASVNAGGAGLQKYFANLLDHKQDRTEGVPGDMAFGAAASLGSDAVVGGLSKAADKLMHWATGMRKYAPGVGNALADMGVVGTQSGMEGQVGSKLAAEESALQDLVGGLDQTTDSKALADAIAAKGEKLVSPSGITLDAAAGDLQKVKGAAGQFDPSAVGAEGPTRGLSPQDLLSLKRQGDWLGYTNSGTPASAMEAEIGRTVGDTSRGLLSEMSGGETAASLGRERALILAKKALEKPETVHQGMGSSLFFGKLPGSSLAGSLAGQAAQKTSNALSPLTDPAVMQGLFGVSNSTR